MSARYVFVAILTILTAIAAVIIILQPGRFDSAKELTDSAKAYESYLNGWTTIERAAFAECTLPKTEDKSLNEEEVKACIAQINGAQ